MKRTIRTNGTKQKVMIGLMAAALVLGPVQANAGFWSKEFHVTKRVAKKVITPANILRSMLPVLNVYADDKPAGEVLTGVAAEGVHRAVGAVQDIREDTLPADVAAYRAIED